VNKGAEELLKRFKREIERLASEGRAHFDTIEGELPPEVSEKLRRELEEK